MAVLKNIEIFKPNTTEKIIKMKKFFEIEMPDIKDFFDGETIVIKGSSDK